MGQLHCWTVFSVRPALQFTATAHGGRDRRRKPCASTRGAENQRRRRQGFSERLLQKALPIRAPPLPVARAPPLPSADPQCSAAPSPMPRPRALVASSPPWARSPPRRRSMRGATASSPARSSAPTAARATRHDWWRLGWILYWFEAMVAECTSCSRWHHLGRAGRFGEIQVTVRMPFACGWYFCAQTEWWFLTPEITLACDC
jgi:hypothetical protein